MPTTPRLGAVIVGMVLTGLLAACGSEVDLSAGGGDGSLDCVGAQVERGAHAVVEAESESVAVSEALAEWTEAGGTVVEGDEFWYVILDGRDVAIAQPERNGDGSWTATLITCGEPETGPAPIDGVLDCADEREWIEQAGVDGTVPGLPSPEEAVREVLGPYQQSSGGEIVLDGNTGSLVVEDREQVVVRAIEVPAGGWGVETTTWCMDFVE